MTIQALKRKKQELLASQVSRIASDTNENLLRVNLSKFFTDLEHEIQSALLEYWNDHMLLQGQVNLILASIHEKHQEYYELIMKHKLQEFHRAEKLGERLVKRQEQSAMKATKPVKITANRDNLFGTLKYSEDKLANDTFTASQNTLNRVDSNINDILLDGYKSGVGINEVSRQITERFDQLRTWEAKRIARTEIHTAQNMGVMNSYDQLGVEYTQWKSAHDKRVRGNRKSDRANHIIMDGEIIPFGGTYSNGLKYPGDKSGKIEEWINCRCSNAPFVLPAGMMAPSFSPFREEDLIPVETRNLDELMQKANEQGQQMGAVESNNQLLGDGNYRKYSETTEHGREFDVYKFENIEIAVEKGADISIERFARHLDNLPKEMVSLSNAKRIEFCIGDVLKSEYGGPANAAGLYYSDKQQISLYLIDEGEGIKDWILSNFDHEFSHSIDLTREGKIVYSHPKVYDKIVRLDNKFHGDELVDVFPTEYAGAGYLNYPTSGRFPERRYLEDFAESSKLYLRPTTHKEFCEKFPNRAKYLEGIYGKPKLKNVEYSDVNKIVKPVQHYSKIDDVVKEYDSQLNDIDNELAKLDEARDNARQKQRACETEECKDKWSAKRRELRTERKRLNKVKEEIFDERYEIAKRKYK